jgi:hypothetical protein
MRGRQSLFPDAQREAPAGSRRNLSPRLCAQQARHRRNALRRARRSAGVASRAWSAAITKVDGPAAICRRAEARRVEAKRARLRTGISIAFVEFDGSRRW